MEGDVKDRSMMTAWRIVASLSCHRGDSVQGDISCHCSHRAFCLLVCAYGSELGVGDRELSLLRCLLICTSYFHAKW